MQTESALSVAVIVPVLHDTEAFCRLCAAIDEWRVKPQEVMAVSGAADEELERKCREGGYRYVEAAANRGTQLDVGARATQAPMLWFLHADAVVPPRGIERLTAAVAAGAESGCFRFAFQGRRNVFKSMIEILVALRIRYGGIPYGDQALFVTRNAYFECGGFELQPLFEEVRLVKRLRKRGTFVRLAESVAVSTRRWERDGWWRRTLHNRYLALCYTLGVPAERLALAYGPLNKAEPERHRRSPS